MWLRLNLEIPNKINIMYQLIKHVQKYKLFTDEIHQSRDCILFFGLIESFYHVGTALMGTHLFLLQIKRDFYSPFSYRFSFIYVLFATQPI